MIKKKIKVLHFIGQGTVGGQERSQYQLFKELDKCNDIDLCVAVVRNKGLYIEKLKESNIKLIFLNFVGGFSFNYDRHILSKMKEYNIHHLHDPSPNIIIYSLFCGKSIKRVFTRRGGIFFYEPNNFKKRLKFHIKKFLIRKYFDGFSGNSKNAVRSVKLQYGITGKEIKLLYNGLDFDLLNCTYGREEILNQLDLDANDYFVGTACRLVKWKRIDFLINAFSKLGIRNKRLLIFGDGTERANLEKLAFNLGISKEVRFFGEVKNMANYFQLFDCFVLPSSERESFGNAVVEAMYFKIPSIIMKDSEGLKEHISHGETGFIAKNEEELASHIELIYNNREKGKAIGVNAHKYVTQKYSVENMISAYKNFYFEIMNDFSGEPTATYKRESLT